VAGNAKQKAHLKPCPVCGLIPTGAEQVTARASLLGVCFHVALSMAGMWTRRVIGAGHARVQMDLGIPSKHTIPNQFTPAIHGFLTVQVPPRIWSKVIATQQDSMLLKANFLRQ
jgi:hypothetical protein